MGTAPEILTEALREGSSDYLNAAIMIADRRGRKLVIVPFAEALPPRLRSILEGRSVD